MWTDVAHILPWALLACVLTVGLEIGLLALLRQRSITVNIAASVALPILAVLIFVVAISGFMFTTELRGCGDPGSADRHGSHGGRGPAGGGTSGGVVPA